jgi:hypothetical protein
VLFENLELLRTVEAVGGNVAVASWLDVEREPPDTRHFLSQRVRQAYDSFAQPGRLVAELAILPVARLVVRHHDLRGLVPLATAAIATAEAGRRRGERRLHPRTAALWAPLWLAERGVCAWLAVGCRVVLGGMPYGGGRLRRAATSRRELERRLAEHRLIPVGVSPDPAELVRALHDVFETADEATIRACLADASATVPTAQPQRTPSDHASR